MSPAAAYFSMRSGRIPSDENRTAREVDGLPPAFAIVTGAATRVTSSDSALRSATIRRRAIRDTGHLHDERGIRRSRVRRRGPPPHRSGWTANDSVVNL